MAIHMADQNEDGKLDFKDFTAMAESVGSTVKKGTQVVRKTAEEKARLIELKVLQPIFDENLEEEEFFMPKFIRVTERDKKRAESDVCKGAIGFVSEQKGLRIVNIFRDSIDSFKLIFYPDSGSEFYYVDPSNQNRYIALNDYFSHLKLVRVNELQKIAQDLGAKHFKITYKEEKVSLAEKNDNIKVNIKSVSSGERDYNYSDKSFSTIEVASEMTFPGHSPVTPRLTYLVNDENIKTLIAMRMDENAPLLHQKCMLKLSNSSGLKESEAIKIDAVLKGMKCAGNTTVVSEVQNEFRRYLEYEIDF
nr:hypothetical protein [uncultured Sellimonas sp.]